MELLKNFILEHGVVLSEEALNVSQFLNEQVNAELMQEIGKNFANYFADYEYDGFVTVESSGIAPSIFASLYAKKPLVVIKKKPALLNDSNFIQEECKSFTKKNDYFLTSQKKLIANQKLILLDDFLAEGNVMIHVEALLEKANSTLVATGIVISKDFQPGYQQLSKQNKDIYRLAGIASLDPATNTITFTE